LQAFLSSEANPDAGVGRAASSSCGERRQSPSHFRFGRRAKRWYIAQTSRPWAGNKLLVRGTSTSFGDGAMTKPAFIVVEMGARVTAHALHVGDRINTTGFEGEALSAVPLAIRVGRNGIAVLFRYGVAVLICVSPEDEIGFLETLKPRIDGILARFEEETAVAEFTKEAEDQVQAGGPIQLRDMSPERLLVIADVLAKSVALAHGESV
jgi:uncharacterized Rmd1/YagE family protein